MTRNMKRIEEIRNYCKYSGALYIPDMKFLLARLDEAMGKNDVLEHINQKTQERLAEARAALQEIEKCETASMEVRYVAHKALGEE